jgi:Tol biopolymer transport system component
MFHQRMVRARSVARLLPAVLVVVLVAGFAAPSALAASPETADLTFPVSVSAAGAWADGEGVVEYTTPSVSADGRYVAFVSAASNLGEAGPADVAEGFVKDLATGAVSLVSRADGPGGEAAGEPGISNLRLSADGRFVVFTSAATNLGPALPGEEAGEMHVYRRDLETSETTLVDRVSGPAGATFSRGAEAAAVSADGRYVAFTARVENLEDPGGDHSETANAVAYVRDLETETTTAVSRASGASGAVGDEPAEWVSIAPDGRSVAFASRATNLVPGVEEGVWEQVYRRDLETEATSLVSQNTLGEAGDRSSVLPAISGADGCFVTFSSIAFNLLQPSPLEVSGEQVYVADVCASPATVTLASKSASAPFAPFAYSVAASSEDGSKAIFAAEFVGSPCCHLYLRDLAAGTTAQLDRASGAAGALSDAEVQQFALSANGCRAVFATRATNLYGEGPPQGEEPTEVYVRQLAPCTEPDPIAGGDSGKTPDPPGPAARQPPAGKLEIRSVERRKLVLGLSAAAQVSVRVRRLIPTKPREWKLIRTLAGQLGSAGTLELPLPALAPGRYRFNVHLHGAPAGAVRWLTVGRRD